MTNREYRKRRNLEQSVSSSQLISAGNDIGEFLAVRLRDPSCTFSVGAFGAVAEFSRDVDETYQTVELNPLTALTARGGMRISLHEDMLMLACETASTDNDRWVNGLSLCLPKQLSIGSARTVVTELGPDEGALLMKDREDVLFDIGVGAINVDFCVRTNDSILLAALRSGSRESLLDGPQRLMQTVIEASPHRVVISRLARTEIFQPIGTHETPTGPHTHVLPKLLRSRRSHDANVPIPHEYLPCLNVHLMSPFIRGGGELYDDSCQREFEELLGRWGLPDYVEYKTLVSDGVLNNSIPEKMAAPVSRLQRSALRVGLRQLARNPQFKKTAERWRAHFDVQ